MNFCRCQNRKLDPNAPLSQEIHIICPVCKLTVKCGDCPKPARYFDVFSEPKCDEHNRDFLI